MIIGYVSVTAITVDKDIDLYYGPTKASSTVTADGAFRMHILPSNIQTILVISRDFAGVDQDREALYSVKDALKIHFISPITIESTAKNAFRGNIPEACTPLTPKVRKKPKNKS